MIWGPGGPDLGGPHITRTPEFLLLQRDDTALFWRVNYQLATLRTVTYEFLIKPEELGISRMSQDPLPEGGVWARD